ncbi:hypothetical protein CPAST_c08000 [Clostridium pasteurianum DSM 525 = ATCC 6013]|uniref:Uncharacterized protein n=1 Tax=Clostridium pasteurianum DSM 525 = ATCC 6013 TaxID=1262449 RepID=A0A0H3J7E0_CLOPA|nr:hypothetical protein [Clostridium pasteurianum]AJA46900.1 hypothetical protein CPAST_c08000 [Clostridium pasteurianum DSM 525 = ATCC 6013]AJA50888.1 hypothetical protein CLPA_c08000 [Clostridium pasteurianum DSM 525 = ATCC 6013]AOZ74284.1 hypothetical protein AQ983_03865 [Clostridium pasteurianum DSM 525 = ATCC 6013]AOZ78082.1 hypothetical protein AQ984_03870 [Clostridium pasteurianum]ELP58150.1 hypothetical protein F502_15650 [Clostridium pasteurianum DSM 525 = ATCC 6013]
MKTKVLEENSSAKTENFKMLEEKLDGAENTIRDCIKLTLEDINSNPDCEKEYIESWASYLKGISDYFFQASENSGNKNIYKKVFRRMIFK